MMAQVLDKATIVRLLADLGRKDRKRRIFGSVAHDYKLNPPIPVSTIEQFEARHSIRLPEDYRYIITEIGNGGAGPNYGLLPFGQHDDSVSWEEGGLIGDVSQPFPHVEAWNLPESFFEQAPNVPPETPLEEEDRLWEEWDKVEQEHYWNPAIMNGAIPICHLGCALRQWLIVTGDQKGFIWNDFRADHGGILPLKKESGEQMTFSDWYMSWLTEPFRKAGPLGKFVDLMQLADKKRAVKHYEQQAGADAAQAERDVSAVAVRQGMAKLRSRRPDLLAALLIIVVGLLLGVFLALWRGRVLSVLRVEQLVEARIKVDDMERNEAHHAQT